MIVFDKFHIAKHLGDAVDKVRRRENRELVSKGNERLKRSKYLWLQNPDRMSTKRWREFAPLRDSRLKVARAWAIKEAAMLLWGYVRRGWAERMWDRWYGWAIRSRLEPIKRVARMIKRHWEGVINAATTGVTNARAEAINGRIQWLKRMACGYRNRANFRNAIYFHLGGLDLYPEALKSAHSKA
jgi:transposase